MTNPIITAVRSRTMRLALLLASVVCAGALHAAATAVVGSTFDITIDGDVAKSRVLAVRTRGVSIVGFLDAGLTTSDETSFTAITSDRDGNRITITGKMNGDQISGSISRDELRGQPPVSRSFTGKKQVQPTYNDGRNGQGGYGTGLTGGGLRR